MNRELKAYIKNWMRKADHDFIAARKLITLEPLILDVVCFHCQQAVEKYLKAFLIYHRFDVPRTHDVDFLLEQCKQIDNRFDQISLNNLNDFAVEVRYPDQFLQPEMEEAECYLKIAKQVQTLVQAIIRLD